jgi:hypothetical protein
MNPNQPPAAARCDPRLRRLVPLTELRHFYELLRKTLVSTEVQESIAEEIRRQPGNLQSLVERSREHVCLYDNRGEGFHERQPPGSLSDRVLASQKPVHEVLRRISQQGIRIPTHPELDADYVDYELHPLRTTGWAEFENGEACGVRGGIDILLANNRDKLPVLVEQKGKNDVNLFLALVQALTYAVEFSTPWQRERLARFYPGRFAWGAEEPALDIYLVLVEEPASRSHLTFLRIVDKTCEQLLTPGTAVAAMVRRIACLQTDDPDGNPVPLRVNFQHPRPQSLTPPTG